MKSYKCLEYLKERNIDFIYTPFDQGATEKILDPKWLGSCRPLSYNWMFRKISEKNIQDVSIEKITKPNYPHPVNMPDESSIGEIEKCLASYYTEGYVDQCILDYDQDKLSLTDDDLNASIEFFLNYIESKKFNYGIINTSIIIYEKNDTDLASFGHAISFVKRDEGISWFDPNYGEITFSKIFDFKIWFKEEVKNGVLNFIFSTKEKRGKTLADFFPQPEFTQEQKDDTNPLSKQVIERRIKQHEQRSKITKFAVGYYGITNYSGEIYINPKEKKQKEIQTLQFTSLWKKIENTQQEPHKMIKSDLPSGKPPENTNSFSSNINNMQKN